MKHAVHGPLVLSMLLSIPACSLPDGSLLGAPNQRADGLHPKDVVVLDAMGVGIEGVLIATHSSDGRLDELHRTGPDGSVRVKIPHGGSVTRYANWDPMSLETETVFDAHPGPVRFTDWSYFTPFTVEPEDVTTFEITAVGGPPDATYVVAVSRCGSTSWGISEVGVLDNYNCTQSSSDSIFVYLSNDSGETLSWGWASEVPTNPGAVVPVVIDASHTETAPHTVRLADVPDDPLWNYGVVAGYLTWDGPPFQNVAPFRTEMPEGDPLAWTSYLPDAAFPAWAAVGQIEYELGWAYGAEISLEAPTDVTYSLAGLPALDVAWLDLAESGSPTMRWTARGDVDADVAFVSSGWSLPDGRSAQVVGVTHATETGEVRLPDLPPEFAAWAPDATATRWDVFVEMSESTVTDSWRDVLAEPSRGGLNSATRVGTWRGSTWRSPPIPTGAPTIEITGHDIVGGDVAIAYTLFDEEEEPAEIQVYAYNADFVGEATQAGGDGKTGLATSVAGTPHVFLWDADADLPGYTGPVTLAIQPWDADGNGDVAYLEVMLEDAGAPSVTITTPTASGVWTVASLGAYDLTVAGTASDDEGPVTVTWSNALTGASGTMSDGSPWEGSIAVVEGTNPITVQAIDGDGKVSSAMLVVESNPSAVWAWGDNASGQLGIGSFESAAFPTPLALGGVVAVAASSAHDAGQHTLALLADGTVLAWGDNAQGQLGDGTTTPSAVPVPVVGLTDVVGIACGATHSLAVRSDGTIAAWGSNPGGELGNGTQTDSPVPVLVSGISNAVAVAAGTQWSMALLDDGTIRAWGNNLSGNFGNGQMYTGSSTPVPGPALDNVVEISAGYFHALALLDDGTVRAWGFNARGQLGDGTTIDSALPVDPGLTGVRAVSAGTWHSLALLDDGTIQSWGANDSGQLGDGSYTDRPLPGTVLGIESATAISAGYVHSAAIQADGTLATWGWAGSTASVPFGWMTGPTTLSAGGLYTIAVRGP